MEEIVGVVIESHLNPSTFTGNWMYLHWFFCGDKCKYIDFRTITNFEIHLLYLVAGLLEDKAFRKGLVDVYIFSPTHCFV